MTLTLQNWFKLYSENHQNPVNKKIHYSCVPLIFFSVLGMLSLIQIPAEAGENIHFRIGLHHLALSGVLIFYLRHSVKIFFGMTLIALMCVMLIEVINIQNAVAPWQTYVLIFSLAWIGQFIGHTIEGKKPSFFTDMVFLLIGPAWIVNNVLSKLKFE